MLNKIISGGQTGADLGGLEAGKELLFDGITTGGTAPKGWITEDGPQKELLSSYGLVECTKKGYPPRTLKNVLNSDATVIIGNIHSAGSALTKKYCIENCKPWIHLLYNESLTFENASLLANFIEDNEVKILNVAGNCESNNKGIQNYTKLVVTSAISILRISEFGRGINKCHTQY